MRVRRTVNRWLIEGQVDMFIAGLLIGLFAGTLILSAVMGMPS